MNRRNIVLHVHQTDVNGCENNFLTETRIIVATVAMDVDGCGRDVKIMTQAYFLTGLLFTHP